MQLLCLEWRCDLGAAFVLPICRDLQNNLQIASIAAGAWNRLASVEYLYAAIARSVETRGSTAAVIWDHVIAPDSRAQTHVWKCAHVHEPLCGNLQRLGGNDVDVRTARRRPLHFRALAWLETLTSRAL